METLVLEAPRTACSPAAPRTHAQWCPGRTQRNFGQLEGRKLRKHISGAAWLECSKCSQPPSPHLGAKPPASSLLWRRGLPASDKLSHHAHHECSNPGFNFGQSLASGPGLTHTLCSCHMPEVASVSPPGPPKLPLYRLFSSSVKCSVLILVTMFKLFAV